MVWYDMCHYGWYLRPLNLCAHHTFANDTIEEADQFVDVCGLLRHDICHIPKRSPRDNREDMHDECAAFQDYIMVRVYYVYL